MQGSRWFLDGHGLVAYWEALGSNVVPCFLALSLDSNVSLIYTFWSLNVEVPVRLLFHCCLAQLLYFSYIIA